MGEVAKAAPDDLLALAQAADRGEAAPAAAPAVEGAAPAAVDDAAQWVEASRQFGSIARTALPAIYSQHWTDARLEALGVALARCAKHYGWKFGAFLNHPVAGLAVAAFPLAWPMLEPHVMPYLKRAAPAAEAPAEPEASPPTAPEGGTGG